jgi:hypothetical protein
MYEVDFEVATHDRNIPRKFPKWRELFKKQPFVALDSLDEKPVLLLGFVFRRLESGVTVVDNVAVNGQTYKVLRSLLPELKCSNQEGTRRVGIKVIEGGEGTHVRCWTNERRTNGIDMDIAAASYVVTKDGLRPVR